MKLCKYIFWQFSPDLFNFTNKKMALPFFLSTEDGILEHFSRSLNHTKSLSLKGKIFMFF